MTSLCALPERIHRLTAEIKDAQKTVETLHRAEKNAYKTYVRARAKLMLKKHQDLQDKNTRKWYNLWVVSVSEIQRLMDQIKQAEATLAELKKRRADYVAQDREMFESGLLQR